MTNTEVEDVLASIRRLVSDDNRLEPEQNKPAPTDRLVLTPALRVMEDDDLNTEEPVATTPVEDPLDAVEALDAASDDEPTEVASAAPQTEDIADTDHATGEIQDIPADDDVAGANEGENPITLDKVDLDQDTLMSIQDAFSDIAVPADAPSDTAETNDPDASTPLSEKIAALETLIAGQTEEFEPDMVGDGDNAGTEPPTLQWEDAEATPEPVEAFEDTPEPVNAAVDEPQVFSSDEDVLDEEALRDLVSDIVREELQGALGERITRNVRKLVRREIHRALAAQELE
ncbi:hypothetical protein [Tateyamaria omphalii]|uniref:hypothetical protein n=1 Tax=Tateyamaria omphalii TaxID=299262 RepID=UPI0021BD0F38|nr:hypothetical protein [Tateyamaria omphalii]